MSNEFVLKSGEVEKRRQETWYPGPDWQKRCGRHAVQMIGVLWCSAIDLVRVDNEGLCNYFLVYRKRRHDYERSINQLILDKALCQVGSKDKNTFRCAGSVASSDVNVR